MGHIERMPFSRSHVSSVELITAGSHVAGHHGGGQVPFDPSEISNSQDSSNRSTLSVQDNDPQKTIMAMKNKKNNNNPNQNYNQHIQQQAKKNR